MNRFIATSNIAAFCMKHRITQPIIANLQELYVNEKDTLEQEKIIGMIDAIEDNRIKDKPALFDLLEKNKSMLKSISDSDEDIWLPEEIAYYKGYCDGIRRLIGLHKEIIAESLERKIFLIIYAANDVLRFELQTAFMLNAEEFGIFEFTSLDNLSQSSYFISTDIEDICNILDNKHPDFEYLVLLVYEKNTVKEKEDITSDITEIGSVLPLDNLKRLSNYQGIELLFLPRTKKFPLSDKKYFKNILKEISINRPQSNR